ncbi:alpha/beta fold hydrolase [Streptomyces bottropensis]|uniref:alpha/beta fold hydrolase n=1 Tax=Streptomyces bottropensis TaxID=42235 RepID=UPI0037B387C0
MRSGLRPRPRSRRLCRSWHRCLHRCLLTGRQVANGDNDRMVPTSNSHDMARRLPNAELVIYPDGGHGGIFQYHEQFVPTALEFFGRP